MTGKFYQQWVLSTRSQEEKTEDLVKLLFQDKVDKAGKPYIDHLYHVRDHFSSSNERIIALLHDVLEDTELTALDLEQLGYSREIIETVQLLTRSKDNTYEEYIDDLLESNSKEAIRIKYVDLLHNMDIETRLLSPKAEDYTRVREKYFPAFKKIVEYLEKKEG